VAENDGDGAGPELLDGAGVGGGDLDGAGVGKGEPDGAGVGKGEPDGAGVLCGGDGVGWAALGLGPEIPAASAGITIVSIAGFTQFAGKVPREATAPPAARRWSSLRRDSSRSSELFMFCPRGGTVYLMA
jgi:hypothetical protein